MLAHRFARLGRNLGFRFVLCSVPVMGLAFVATGASSKAVAPGIEFQSLPTEVSKSWQDAPKLGCGSLTPSGDVETTCSLGVRWSYIGDAEETNNLGPRAMKFFTGSDGSLKVVSKAKDPQAEVAVQVGIQPSGESRFIHITQRMSDGGMRVFDSFRYNPNGSYSMVVHDLTGRESWSRMEREYRSDGRTLERSVAYLRDGTISTSYE